VDSIANYEKIENEKEMVNLKLILSRLLNENTKRGM